MTVLEQYEWSDIWWDEPAEDGKRVLVVGDSITRAMKPVVKENLGDIHLDMYATSKCIDNPNFMRELKYLTEISRYDLIYYNNGLHGTHLVDDGYRSGTIEALEHLKSVTDKIVIATLAPLTEVIKKDGSDEVEEFKFGTERDAYVVSRNKILKALAAENGFPIIELYDKAYGKQEIRHVDGIHYNSDGYKLLGDFVAENILKYL